MLQEVRHAFRLLARNLGFTLIATLSLALGIGANSAIFSLADALLLRPLAVLNPSSVVTISTDRADSSDGVGGVSYLDYNDMREKSRSFDGMAAFTFSNFSMARSSAESPQMRFGIMVSDNYFDVLGIKPAIGRAFASGEGQVPGRDPLVILSYGFWRSEFGADPAILDRTVRINGIDFTVIGVAPKNFFSTDEYVRPYFYLPLSMAQRLNGDPKDPLQDRTRHDLEVKARLKPGVTLDAAQAELAGIWKGLEPLHTEADRHRIPRVRTELQQRIATSPDDAFLVALLMALTAIVLMIACANVANLSLGRARARTREVAIRLAIGISRRRLVRQLLIESSLLSLFGVVAGVGFAYAGIRFLQTIKVPTDIPVVISPQMNARVLLFSLMLGVVSAIAFGLAPALQASKTSLVPALKSAEAAQGCRQRMLARNVLVVAQLALSMVLLVATGMLLDGFRKTLVLDPGFRVTNILTAGFDTSLVRYTPQQSRQFYRTLRDRVGELPGVRGVALASYVPFTPQQRSEAVVPEGFTFPKSQVNAEILTSVVDENYFTVMRTAVLRGRTFTADDKAATPRVAIVNEEFARRYWPKQEALGKRLRLPEHGDAWAEVVGIARTGKYTFVGEPPTPFLYLPYAQNEDSKMALFTDTTANPASLATPVLNVAHSIDPDQPVFNLRTMSDLFSQRNSVVWLIMQIVGTMGMVGLSLAVVGLYGLVAYSVARRTREIGVRIAIGATQGNVVRMVLRQGLTLAAFGIASGGLISMLTARALIAGLVGLGSPNPATYVIVPIVLLTVTLIACYVPARRASQVDPIVALRYE